MTRSLWKGPFIDVSLWKNINKVTYITDKRKVKIWSRRSTIFPVFIGKKYEIYTGNKWVNLTINEDKIGHFFGELAFTKKIAQYKRKTKMKSKKKGR